MGKCAYLPKSSSMFCLTGRRFLGLMGDNRADGAGAGGGFPGAAPKAPAVSAFLLVATGGPVLLKRFGEKLFWEVCIKKYDS